MTLDRRRFVAGMLAAAGVPLLPSLAVGQGGDARSILQAELDSGRPCASEARAIRNTLSRMTRSRAPREGRTVVVDMPSQQLACYEGSDVVLTSRVVVGSPEWQTPDLDTTFSFVRFNPTWTVPRSIVSSRGWTQRLSDDPDYFERLGFEVQLDGRLVPPSQAAHRASQVGWFVQQPGQGNALGLVKLGLNAGDAIFLHDTNDHSAYDDDLRAASHGCMRVERAIAVAAWVLSVSEDEANWRVQDDDRTDYRGFPPVRFVNTYFTAWPDEFGVVQYYPDIYDRDGNASGYCSGSGAAWNPGSQATSPDGAPAQIVILEDR